MQAVPRGGLRPARVAGGDGQGVPRPVRLLQPADAQAPRDRPRQGDSPDPGRHPKPRPHRDLRGADRPPGRPGPRLRPPSRRGRRREGRRRGDPARRLDHHDPRPDPEGAGDPHHAGRGDGDDARDLRGHGLARLPVDHGGRLPRRGAPALVRGEARPGVRHPRPGPDLRADLPAVRPDPGVADVHDPRGGGGDRRGAAGGVRGGPRAPRAQAAGHGGGERPLRHLPDGGPGGAGRPQPEARGGRGRGDARVRRRRARLCRLGHREGRDDVPGAGADPARAGGEGDPAGARRRT